ncbi:UNVERIFIED_CONTAM: hypothetical protein GTU68_013720 [Idotea baltica]|nr:hypothetical protein [Idotea baltica]
MKPAHICYSMFTTQ